MTETHDDTIEAIIARLQQRYAPRPNPVCRLCGHEMTPARMESGATEWVCDGPKADWMGKQGPERRAAEDHYAASRYRQTQFEDEDVLALIAYVEQHRST